MYFSKSFFKQIFINKIQKLTSEGLTNLDNAIMKEINHKYMPIYDVKNMPSPDEP